MYVRKLKIIYELNDSANLAIAGLVKKKWNVPLLKANIA